MTDAGFPAVVQITTSDYDAMKARIAELEAALKPFARVADWDIADNEPNTAKYYPMDGRYAVGGVLKIGDFRRALAALEKDRADE